MLLETAIGDALGAPYEFAAAERRAEFSMGRYATEDGVGRYTDDTQMAMAVAEHMLRGDANTQEAWAESFLRARHRDPLRRGYSRRVSKALEAPSPRAMLALTSSAVGVRGNGSVMRCVPLGMLPDPDLVTAMCAVQSTVTHASLECAQAACAVALAAHYCYHLWPKGGDHTARFGAAQFVGRVMGEGWTRDLLGSWTPGQEVACDARQTAAYCILSLVRGGSLELQVRACVEAGGDVDSTASICCGLDSLVPGGAAWAPGPLLEHLESGPFGRRRLELTDAALLKRFPRNKARKQQQAGMTA